MECQKILLDPWGRVKVKNNLILHFNYQLDKRSNFYSLNESGLENLIEQLDHLVYFKDASFWLTMARINELALLCTENYANNGELTLVGDLLLNPRLILVHIKGENRPVVKKRHTPLTEQFRFAGKTAPEVIEWLKTETCLEIKTEALLPYLHQRLEKSEYFRREYFESLTQRKAKIAELTGFLAGIGPSGCFDLYQWLHKAGPADREMIKAKFCRCNRDCFFELGSQVRDLAQGPMMPTVFKHPRNIDKIGGVNHVESDLEYQRSIRSDGIG